MKKFAIILFLIPFALMAQRDWANLKIDVTELSPGLYRLFLDNSVAVVVSSGSDDLLVIDAAWEQSAERLKQEIRTLSDAPIRYLINTHLHGDHTGGNKVIGRNATIIAHPTVRDFLATEQRRGETVIPPFPDYALPDKLVDSNMQLSFNGENIQIIPLGGGHTTGDLIVYFPQADVLVMGDLLFAGLFPFVDVSNGGNPMKFMENVQTIINRFPESITLVGGHGPVFTMDDLRSWHQQLSKTMDVVKNAKARGMTPDEMKEQRILREWEQMGGFFITENRWIDTLYPFL